MKKSINRFVYWIPRILSIIFIVFLFLMSLDVFSSESSWWQVLIGFLIHNIPVFILSAVLIISWKYEIVGGIVFILAGLLYSILLMRNQFEWYYLVWAMQISGIAFVIGALYLVNWFRK